MKTIFKAFKSIAFYLALAVAVPAFFGIANVFLQKNNNLGAFDSYTQTNIYKERVDEIAESVAFSNSFQDLYRTGETVTIYNFISVIRFNAEQEVMNQTTIYDGLTNYQLLQKMFNDNDYYSVKKYYEVVSNGRLNLETIFVNGSSSLEITEFNRHDLVDMNTNQGSGYDPEQNYIINLGIFGSYELPVSERYVLEYKLLDNVAYSVKSYLTANSMGEEIDSNQDGYIDAFTVFMMPDDPLQGTPALVTVNWADLLWPHMSQIAVDAIEDAVADEVGVALASMAWSFVGINKTYFEYSFDDGGNTVTKKFGKYLMTDMETSVHSASYPYPKNNTEIHELGHMLGFPDYYNYEGTEGQNLSVDVWDLMAYNHLNYAQYPLSYNRYNIGWLDDENITSITTNGNYTLMPVNYEETSSTALSNRTVAYKIESPDYPGQSIYIEYRKQSSSSFENNGNSVTDGLLVYRVDENLDSVFSLTDDMDFDAGFTSAGNFYAAPYNVYVFRNDLTGTTSKSIEVQMATLNTYNKGMGTEESYTLPAQYASLGQAVAGDITWQVYEGTNPLDIADEDVSYVDSGIRIEVVEMDSGEITFNVMWSGFPNPPDTIGIEEFESPILYYKLLELAGKQSDDELDANDLSSFSVVDLSNLSISSMKGFERLNFDELWYLNLGGNTITNFTYVKNIVTKNPNVQINMVANKVNLTLLSLTDLNSSNYIWGYQYNNTTLTSSNVFKYNDYSLVVYYNWSQTDDFTFMINGEEVISDEGLATYYVDSYGEHTFQIVCDNIESNFFPFSNSLNITIIDIQASTNEVNIERGDDFPSLIVNGIELSRLDVEINSSVTSTDTVTASEFAVTWTVSIIGESVPNFYLTKLYKIVDTLAPVIQINGSSYFEAIKGTIISAMIEDPEILITDNGEEVDYTFVASISAGQTDVWTKAYYEISYSGANIVLGTQIFDIDNLDYGFYAIVYNAVDQSENSAQTQYRVIFITAERLTEDDIPDVNLFEELKKFSSGQYVYVNSVEAYDYVDLSNKGIESLVGLNLLTFKVNAKINLSNNNISNMSPLSLLLSSNPDIEIITLLFNLIETDTIGSNKIILGIQNLDKEVYLYDQLNPNIQFLVFDDYGAEFIYSGYGLTQGTNSISDFGIYNFTFSSLSQFGSITKQIKYGKVYLLQTSINVEAGSSQIELFDYLQWEFLSESDFEVKLYQADQELDPQTNNLTSVLGNNVIEFRIYSLDEQLLKTIEFSAFVEDTIAPTILLNGNSVVYLKKGQAYSEQSAVPSDTFDENPTVQIGGDTINTNTSGIYVIIYRAVDSSNNLSSTVQRTVYVGNVSPKSNVILDYQQNLQVDEMFDFETYTLNDFNVTKIDDYDNEELTIQTISYAFYHKQNPSLYFYVTNQITVMDRVAPVIQLVGATLVDGEYIEYVYINHIYTDKKAEVTDNYSTFSNLISGVGTVNTGVVGEYIVTYNAIDENNNSATPVLRKVIVLPLPIQTGAFTIQRLLQGSTTVGSSSEFVIDLSSLSETTYNHNSTFVWYVDGQSVDSGEGMTSFEYTFTTPELHTISVAVLNHLEDGTTETKTINEITVMVNDITFIERYGFLVLSVGSVSVVTFIIASFVLRRRKKLF